MRIIVIGDGKVGNAIIENVSKEGHQVVVVDNNPNVVEDIVNKFDVMGICGNVPTNEMKGFSGIRQNGFQEMDLTSMTKNITKYSVTVNSSKEFSDIISRAYNIALMGRKGGVIIDFPLDIQQADIISR